MPATPFDLVVFDLDGTLVETRQGICDSVAHALTELGREPLSLETVVGYVGDGARKLMERSLGAHPSEDDVDRALRLFVGHYFDHCTVGSDLYTGVEETLAALADLPLAVLTNKPRAPSERIIESLGLRTRFRELIGGDTEVPRKPDPAGLLGLVERWGTTPGRTLLVGDTSVDVRTARNCGAAVAGAMWGFRPQDFEADPPDWRLDGFASLLPLIRGKMSR